jgi:SAM-dependent methyltransferase
MSLSTEWNDTYLENRHMSTWPWNDVVSLSHSYARLTTDSKVLELGCGAGANIPFFLSLGVDFYAIEGSEAAVNRLLKKFPKLEGKIVCADFTKDIPFPNHFDLVLDRGSITHNFEYDIKYCLSLVHKSLKAGGVLIGNTWMSTSNDYFQKGTPTDDPFTKTNYPDGPYFGIGKVHFFDKNSIQTLLNEFTIIHLEESIRYSHVNSRFFDPSSTKYSFWNLVAKKKM